MVGWGWAARAADPEAEVSVVIATPAADRTIGVIDAPIANRMALVLDRAPRDRGRAVAAIAAPMGGDGMASSEWTLTATSEPS